MKKEIDVVGAIIVKNKKILCCQRGMEKELGGLWEFPGGKIEKNETKIDALHRELKEELKVSVTIFPKEFCFCRHEYDFGFVNLTTFICCLNADGPQLTEHCQFRWLSSEELDSIDWAPADIPSVEKIRREDKEVL